jgi:hypothetical protein
MNLKRVQLSTRRFQPDSQRFAKPSPLALGPDRNICVTEIDGPPLTPTTARQLGAALIAAADEEAVRRLGSREEVARQVGVSIDEFEAFATLAADAT